MSWIGLLEVNHSENNVRRSFRIRLFKLWKNENERVIKFYSFPRMVPHSEFAQWAKKDHAISGESNDAFNEMRRFSRQSQRTFAPFFHFVLLVAINICLTSTVVWTCIDCYYRKIRIIFPKTVRNSWNRRFSFRNDDSKNVCSTFEQKRQSVWQRMRHTARDFEGHLEKLRLHDYMALKRNITELKSVFSKTAKISTCSTILVQNEVP